MDSFLFPMFSYVETIAKPESFNQSHPGGDLRQRQHSGARRLWRSVGRAQKSQPSFAREIQISQVEPQSIAWKSLIQALMWRDVHVITVFPDPWSWWIFPALQSDPGLWLDPGRIQRSSMWPRHGMEHLMAFHGVSHQKWWFASGPVRNLKDLLMDGIFFSSDCFHVTFCFFQI